MARFHAKYTRIVVRIAEREGISCATAVKLYQSALRLGVKNYSAGLRERVAKAKTRREHDAYLRACWNSGRY